MAKLPSAFTSDDHDDMNDFTPIPAGDVNAKIIESDIVPTKAAKEAIDSGAVTEEVAMAEIGSRLNFKFEVIDGDHKGRTFFVGLNITNKNPKAVEISQKELATICRACNKVTVGDTSDLHGIPMLITLKVTEGDANYGPKNEATMYKPYDGEIPVDSTESSADASSPGKAKKKW
jgi:hypothetical protein